MPNAPGTPFRIAQYYQWYKGNQLELAPPFQRKPVWSPRNKSFLIDTILNNLPVPEVYMQVKTDKDGNTKYIVVDGQQRMRAILEFLEGEYSLLEDECPTFADKEFSDLPDGIKREFWNYGIVTRELQTDSLKEVKDIFRRLNKYVVPLNAQELRNATYGGHLIALVNNIADKDDFWAENKIVTPNDIKRMIDAEFIGELFLGMMEGIQQKSQSGIDSFFQRYDQKFLDRESWRKEFEATERKIEDIFNHDLVKTRWRGKADFYSFFIAIYELSKVYYFPEERYDEINEWLTKFASEVDKHVKQSEKSSSNPLVDTYVENVEKRTTHKATRQKRYEIVRELLIPFLIAKDKRKDFNEEERRIAWANSDKKCNICGKKVDWEEYELDHKIPFSKGGKTSLENSQVTHKSCNAQKSNKTA